MSDHDFTGDMADVAEICGIEVARSLTTYLHGITLNIPKKKDGSGLLNRIPNDFADILITQMGGDRIYVSKPKSDRVSNRENIKNLIKEGKPIAEIALELKISDRRVYQLLEKMQIKALPSKNDNDDQLKMFG